MSYQDVDDDKLFLQLSSASAREMLLRVTDGRIKLHCSFLDNYRGCLLKARPRANIGNYRYIKTWPRMDLEVVEHVPTIHYSP